MKWHNHLPTDYSKTVNVNEDTKAYFHLNSTNVEGALQIYTIWPDNYGTSETDNGTIQQIKRFGYDLLKNEGEELTSPSLSSECILNNGDYICTLIEENSGYCIWILKGIIPGNVAGK